MKKQLFGNLGKDKRDGAVDWDTVLQAGKSRIRFTMVSLA